MSSKTLKLFPDSKAGLTVANDSIRINGKDSTSIVANDKGITINGPVSFASGSSQINFSVLWKMNMEPMAMIPSTMATPTPMMMVSPPIGQIKSLISDTALMMAMFGSLV